MEALGGTVDAFRAVDAFAIDAWKAARQMGRGEGDTLSAELRGQLARCGGALVALSGHPPDSPAARRGMEEAREALARCRFALYLARRLGLLELRTYRALAVRGDTALKELSLRAP
jgi:sugar phosphate isomerase/epimerase